MRVVAGELGGRRIVAPEGTSTRPTTDRVREAMFNALGSAGLIDGALVADLFAGSGAIGIEALSRGAERCVFVERDRTALRALDENLATLELGDRTRVLRSDAMSAAATIDADIVFADPPYDFADWSELLGRVRAGIVVAESGRAIEPPAGWSVTRSKRYGRTTLTFLERDDDPAAAPTHHDAALHRDASGDASYDADAAEVGE
jgi:16S rRNA (guanine966-N2)-methyltransferase